jgi:hypothetical protein
LGGLLEVVIVVAVEDWELLAVSHFAHLVKLWMNHACDLLDCLHLLLRAHIVEGLLEQIEVAGLRLVLAKVLHLDYLGGAWTVVAHVGRGLVLIHHASQKTW